jgi:hypothetical protein
MVEIQINKQQTTLPTTATILMIQEAFVPTDHFRFCESAAKVVNQLVPKMPRLSPSTALSEFAAMNKNSEDREREWKIEQERNNEEWKREREEW